MITKVTVTGVAVAITRFPFGMYDRTVDSDAGTSDFWLVRGVLHVCELPHVRSHMPPSTDCLWPWQG